MKDEIHFQVSNYYDELSSIYDEIFDDSVSRAEDLIISEVLSQLIHEGFHVLDCGCGTGLGKELISAKNVHYHGIDISKKMIEQARAKHPDSTFHISDMADLSHYEDESFDALISINGSFSHVHDPAPVSNEMYRVLKPGGKLLTMVYSRYSLGRLLHSWRHGVLTKEALYSVRNADNEVLVPASFYDRGRLLKTFSKFKNHEIDCLNIMAELMRLNLSLSISLKIMKLERRLPITMRQLAHALTITCEK